MTYTDALQGVLAAEHAAVYGYPELGVSLTDAGQIQRARDLEAAHRATRDALMADLAGRGLTPVAASSSYAPPTKITDAAGAWKWAVQLELGCAAAYRYLLASCVTAPAQPATARKAALTGLTTAAGNAASWQLLATPSAPTVAFPGV